MCGFKSSWRVEVVLGALVVWWFAPWRVGRRRLFHADAVGMVGRHWCSGGGGWRRARERKYHDSRLFGLSELV
jgi:hypothetical protein